MPHLHIEYSAGLADWVNIQSVCEAAHQVMLASAVFPDAGIRVRAYRADYAIVADGLAENNFMALTLSVGAGRETEHLVGAGEKIFKSVQSVLKEPLATTHFALSLEIREINADLSWKDTPIHTRLSGVKN